MGMQIDEAKLHQFMGNVLGQLTGATTVACGLVGHRVGFHKAMAGKGPMTADALAKATKTEPRLTREWLDQQASVKFVGYDAKADTYELSPEAAFALADESSPMFIAGSLSQSGRRGLGAQCGEPGMRAVFKEAGYSSFQRAAETPFNIVYQARA